MDRERTAARSWTGWTLGDAVAVALCGSALWASPSRPQSLDLPLFYYPGNSSGELKLTALIGIGDQRPLRYTFDTGSNTFFTQYVPEVYGDISIPQQPNSIFPAGLPQDISYGYGDGFLTFKGTLVGVPSITFYPSSSMTGGVTITAQTPSGAPSAFIANAATSMYNSMTGFNGPITKVEPTFPGVYGDFGAGYWVTSNLRPPSPISPEQGGQTSGILGQAIIAGTSPGYVVAINGMPLKEIGRIIGYDYPAAANANGPQGKQTVTSCSPCAILGLTPALVAQFRPQNYLQWTTTGVPFWNSGNPSGAERGVNANYSFVEAAGRLIKGQTAVVFDTGGPVPSVDEVVPIPAGSTFTYSGTTAGAQQISDTVVPGSPYGFHSGQTVGSNFGIEFFLQNSVLFDLGGQALAYTSNFVTDVDIPTTQGHPLNITSASVPLGLAGKISGSGGVRIGDGGSATLSGANSYTGATSIGGGYLALVGPGTIWASSGVEVTEGGVFDISGAGGTFLGVSTPTNATIQSLSGDPTGLVFLGDSDLILSNASGTFAGMIVGAGGLTLKGGVERLAGVSFYSGATTIDGGTLEIDGLLTGTSAVNVNAHGALTGTGIIDPLAVTIAAGGAFAPGFSGGPRATMTIVGDLVLQPGSFYVVGLSPTDANAVHVSGSTTLGGTVQALFALGLYQPRRYTILDASRVSGAFSGVAAMNLPPAFAASLAYTPDAVLLNVSAALAGAGARSENGRRAASALDGAFNAGLAMPASYQQLYALPGSALPKAIDALTGEAATGAATASVALANQFLTLVLNPLVHGPAPPAPGPPRGWNVWAAGFGGSAAASGNAGEGSHNTLVNASGLAAGMDYAVSNNAVVGLALGGSNLGWGLADGLGGGSGQAFEAALYGVARSGPLYVALAGAFAEEWLSTRRAGPLGGPIAVDHTAQDFAGRIELGNAIDWALGSQPLTLSPYVALQAQTVQSPGFSENDLTFSGFGLNASSFSQGYASSEVGVRFDARIPLQGPMAANFRLRAAYAHDWSGEPTIAAAFQSLPGVGFAVAGAALPKNAALVSAEIDVHAGANVSWLFKVDGALAPGANALGGSATLRYAF